MTLVAAASAIVAGAVAEGRADAQQPTSCGAVTVPLPRAQENMFSAAQEEELGLVIKANFEQSVRVLDDPTLTGYLRAVGERLVSRLPPSQLRFRFALADSTDANAFSLPGGSVYITRKLVGLLQSEDELAAVLAHEIGHDVTRQHAVKMTRAFRKALGITSLDNGKVVDRFHELLESGKSISVNVDEGEEREEAADRLGLQILMASGYRVDAMASMFDRLVGLEGRKGNWFTDFLGSTAPNARRLRIMAQQTAAEAACTAPAVSGPEDFKAWQNAVLRYSGIGHAEALPGLAARRKLAPELPPDLRALRFSPDGRYVLAQDDSLVSVFAREGLRLLFQIPASGARSARFSADSQRISFYARPMIGSPRVDVGEGRRVLHVRGFDSAWLGERDALSAVIREEDGVNRAVVTFDLTANPPVHRVSQDAPDGRWSQQGRFVLMDRPGKTNPKRGVLMEARDVSAPAVLWTRELAYDAHSKVADHATGQLVLTWVLADGDARKALTGDPAWQQALGGLKDKDRAVCFEVTDVATGSVRARLAVDSISAALPYLRVAATDDRVFVLESRGRLLAYSFDGRLQGRAFARDFLLAPDGKRVAVSTAPGRLAIMDAAGLVPVSELAFDSPVCLAAFLADSTNLVVVTASQTVYTFDLESARAPASRVRATAANTASPEVSGPRCVMLACPWLASARGAFSSATSNGLFSFEVAQ